MNTLDMGVSLQADVYDSFKATEKVSIWQQKKHKSRPSQLVGESAHLNEFDNGTCSVVSYAQSVVTTIIRSIDKWQ